MTGHRIIRSFFAIAIIGLGLLGITSQGCYYDNVEDLFPGGVCDTTAVSFSADVQPIIDLKCATPGCHVAGGSPGIIMTNYAGIKAKVDDGSFENRALVQKNMPPSGSQDLTNCELDILTAWINAGAPDN
ncbi:MAG: hypothetical protein HKN92_05505 [Chitinophagales bacterium]|nr:hypothetical protein [Chitinophagales bacterium]